MIRYQSLLAMGTILLIVLSCAAHSSGPVVPSENPLPELTGAQAISTAQAGTHLWGLWEVYLDPEKGSADIVPLRGPAFSCNVTGFVDGPPSNMIINIGTVNYQPTYMDIPVDIGLKHPLPGLPEYTGFDVLGVFMGRSTATYSGSQTLSVAGQNDQQLLNPDGYTRWFNAPEFASASLPLLGYRPGKLGTPGFTPSAKLNPYKYFADGLSANSNAFQFLNGHTTNRGCFTPGTTNYRRYELRFPNQTGAKFQYAVIAHWEEGTSPYNLNNFPPKANADEAIAINVVDHSNLFYVNSSLNGGHVIIEISPWDWSATCSNVMTEYNLTCYSSAWTGPQPVDMTPVGGGVHYSTFMVDIAVSSLSSTNPLPVWIEVKYPALDYKNVFGVTNQASGSLIAYHMLKIPVGDSASMQVISPNGGEQWAVGSDHDITWTCSISGGSVRIDYSKDNFISDIHLIASGEPNDGSYTWHGVPNDASSSLRIRVTHESLTTLHDESDNPFTIIYPIFTVISPNGSETWLVASTHEIKWSSNTTDGPLTIEYSKDNFAADLHTIATDESNDGSLIWPSIPNDPSSTVRVRVAYQSNPTLGDTSNNYFTICNASFVGNVTGFSASDALASLNQREVRLTWNAVAGCVEYYEIERYDYIWGANYTPGSWQWTALTTVEPPATGYIDTNAPYAGTSSARNYRIRARSQAYASPSWTTDTGYPRLRNMKMSFWCWAQDSSGTNAYTTWSRASNDFTWCNTLWNKYGINFVLENTGNNFRWFTNPNWLDITGTERFDMHNACGKVSTPTCLNVYYFRSYDGGAQGAWAQWDCTPDQNTLTNIFIGVYGPQYSPAYEMMLPHECGHAVGRFYDLYFIDLNSNRTVDSGETCAYSTQYYYGCYGYWYLGWKPFCDEAACYPQGGSHPYYNYLVTPKNLMWWGWLTAISEYNLLDSQYAWVDAWLNAHESQFPYP